MQAMLMGALLLCCGGKNLKFSNSSGLSRLIFMSMYNTVEFEATRLGDEMAGREKVARPFGAKCSENTMVFMKCQHLLVRTQTLGVGGNLSVVICTT